MKSNKEQDTSNHKHKEFISSFEPPLFISAFTAMKDFTIY